MTPLPFSCLDLHLCSITCIVLYLNTLTISLLWISIYLRAPLATLSALPSSNLYKALIHFRHFYCACTLSSPLFSSYRHSLSSVPKSSCNWEGAKPQTTKPSPPHNTGNTEGDALPNAQNRSEENKITAHSWTLLPNCLTCGRKACRWIRGRRLWAQRIFLLSVSNPDINLQSSLSVHAWAFLQCRFSRPIEI